MVIKMISPLYIIELKDTRVWKTTAWAFHTKKEARNKAEELRKEGVAKEVRVQKYISIKP